MDKRTIKYYNDHVSLFTNDTVSANMSDAQKRFLSFLKQTHPDRMNHDLSILDFGCGSGRDTKFFLENGFHVSAFDGSKELAEKASQYTGISVKNLLFQDFHETNQYDGIWACASILHLHREELPDVLKNICTALKQDGVLYLSFKYGDFKGYRNDRYYTDLNEISLNAFVQDISEFTIEQEWISNDVRPDRNQEQWINALIRKN
jgi:SAM-dependent methyltransferase